MLRVPGAFLLLGVTLAGCGSSVSTGITADSAVGTIAFGTSQTNHKLHDPRTSFGPEDTIAYVAHLRTKRTLRPHTKIREFYVRVESDGTEEPVLNDTFSLNVSVHRFITFNSFPIREFYMVGFARGNTYKVRLIQGGEKLAEGTFRLR
jgi:hypothetical protein